MKLIVFAEKDAEQDSFVLCSHEATSISHLLMVLALGYLNFQASSSSGSKLGWNQICAIRVGTTALPITAVRVPCIEPDRLFGW